MPSAPPTSGARSEKRTSGNVRGGNPSGSRPTSDTPWSASSNTAAIAMEATTATKTPGTRGSQRCRPLISANPRRPTASAAPTVSPSATPVTNPSSSSMKPSASTENPKSLGNWPKRIVTASPFM